MISYVWELIALFFHFITFIFNLSNYYEVNYEHHHISCLSTSHVHLFKNKGTYTENNIFAFEIIIPSCHSVHSSKFANYPPNVFYNLFVQINSFKWEAVTELLSI